MKLLMSLKLELLKLKHRYFFITWFILSLVPTLFTLYNLRNIGETDRFIFSYPSLTYFYSEASNIELLSLFLPILASLLISKLIDNEHKGHTWKLLFTSNQSFYSLWFTKFLIVYVLLEVTTFLLYVTSFLYIYFKTKFPIPFMELSLSFIGISGANLVTLTIAQIISIYFKNQLIVLIEGLIGGFIGIISSLLPPIVCYFLPWGYYSLNILAGNKPIGIGQDGLTIWEVYFIEPNYLIIFLVSVLFLGINLVFSYWFSKRKI